MFRGSLFLCSNVESMFFPNRSVSFVECDNNKAYSSALGRVKKYVTKKHVSMKILFFLKKSNVKSNLKFKILNIVPLQYFNYLQVKDWTSCTSLFKNVSLRWTKCSNSFRSGKMLEQRLHTFLLKFKFFKKTCFSLNFSIYILLERFVCVKYQNQFQNEFNLVGLINNSNFRSWRLIIYHF